MAFSKSRKWLLALIVAAPLALVVLARRAASARPRLFAGIAAPATSIVLSRDGSQIVCASENGVIQRWRPERERFNSFYFENAMRANAFSSTVPAPVELRISPDERMVVAANVEIRSYKHSAFAWTMSDRRQTWSLAPQEDESVPHAARTEFSAASQFTLSPDARLLACAGRSFIKILDLSRPQLLPKKLRVVDGFTANFPAHTTLRATALRMAFSPDSRLLATLVSGNQLQIWDISTRTKTPLASPALSSVDALSFSPDARFLAAASVDSSLAIYDFQSKTWTRNLPPGSLVVAPRFMGGSSINPQNMVLPAWMPDSKSLWIGGNTVKQWSVPALKTLRELPVSGPVAVSGDGKILATRSVSRPGESSGIWQWNIG